MQQFEFKRATDPASAIELASHATTAQQGA